DVRYGLRTLRKSPGFTLVALAALALGIGANTAIFSVVNAVLLRPLTYPDPDRIVQFLLTGPGTSAVGCSPTEFNVLQQQTGVFQDVSAYDSGRAGINLTGGAFPEQIHSIRVSADYFHLFGAPIAKGRTFTSEEDRPNSGHFVMLSFGLWNRRFGADPKIIGKTISLGGDPYTVVGVIGRDFVTDPPADAWIPLQIDPNSSDQGHTFVAAGRLRPGVNLDAARAELQLAGAQFRQKFPGVKGPQDGFTVELLQDAIVSNIRASLLVLVGAVGFVLLIACANVANLMLVRATGRRREIAIRACLGAGRGRLIRQMVTESVVLFVTGGALGLALGISGVRALLAVSPGNIPRIGDNGAGVTMDWRVLLFTAAISLCTGIIFGLAPAMSASRVDINDRLKESSGRAGTSVRQNAARSLLVVSETALALVLLIGAALLIRSFVTLRGVNPGFDPHHVLTLRMSLTGERFEKTSGVAELVRDAVQRISALSGVEAVGSTCCLPLEGSPGLPFIVVGRPLGNNRSHGRADWGSVSPDYFKVFKIPVLRGRTFTDRDDGAASPVIVINEVMAHQIWPHGDPLNDRLLIGKGMGPNFEDVPRQIVGIVGDVHDAGLNRIPQPSVYLPVSQVPDTITALSAQVYPIAWVVRTRAEPHSLSSAIENELRQASGGLPVGRVRSMDEILVQSTANADFNMLLLTIFGCAALLLAAIGIYGLMAYTVRQRTQEIGIRLALGANSKQVRNMIVMQGMRLALLGVGIGILAALGLSRLIASLLFDVKTWDPVVFTIVPFLLSLVALLAVGVPALRATRVDPLVALRYE
ncbi:MAG: ABC transporter permease, partial [Candidatus Acidiferrum sp.]